MQNSMQCAVTTEKYVFVNRNGNREERGRQRYKGKEMKIMFIRTDDERVRKAKARNLLSHTDTRSNNVL